jgi:hypothetical protein
MVTCFVQVCFPAGNLSYSSRHKSLQVHGLDFILRSCAPGLSSYDVRLPSLISRLFRARFSGSSQLF